MPDFANELQKIDEQVVVLVFRRKFSRGLRGNVHNPHNVLCTRLVYKSFYFKRIKNQALPQPHNFSCDHWKPSAVLFPPTEALAECLLTNP